MKKGSALAPALVFAMLVNALGQQGPPAAKPAQQPAPTTTTPPAAAQDKGAQDKGAQENGHDEDVVRITTKLVQVDAVVTDKEGRQITDLKPEDFEVLENGRPQEITNFSYVSTAPAAPAVPESSQPAPDKADKAARDRSLPPVPAGRLRPEQVRRAIALVVDDLRMSAEGIQMTRGALRKYVDEQMQPGDLVAIIRTSAGIGALQQFTNDRQQLYAAIERVRTIARSGLRLGAFTSVDMLQRLETQASMSPTSAGESTDSAVRRRMEAADPTQPATLELDRTRTEGINEFRDSLLTVGTVGALSFVVRGLRELPGRKAVVLFSDGISIFNSSPNASERNERVLAALRRLVDGASRASVVIHAIDTRGLQPTGLTAADSTSGGPSAPGDTLFGPLGGVGSIQPDMVGSQVLGARSNELFEGQNGLSYLARETGGMALFNNNDLNKGVRRALDDMKGYYLIGYRPAEETFDPSTGRRRFNTLTVKVKGRSGLRVRTRGGFLAVAEEQERQQGRSRTEQLMAALLSPFASGGVKLHLTSFFLNQADIGSTVRSVVLMDAHGLTFTQQPDGDYKAVLDVIAVTLGEEGQVVDQVNLVETIRAKPAALQRFLREGMVYGLNVPVSRPGAYQLRLAVRDAASGRVGSASQYVEVPKLSKDRLALSSLVIGGNNPAAAKAAEREMVKAALASVLGSGPASSSRIVAGGEGMMGSEDPLSGPASRRFRVGMYLDYACVIYNAKGSGQKRMPALTSQVRLFRDGQEVFTGAQLPVDVSNQQDPTRVVVARRLQLGTVLTPGDYVLLLTVTDGSDTGKGRTSSRWTDFEVVN